MQQNKTTKKHTAEPEPRAVQNTTHTDRGAHGPSELETARSHSKTNLERECPIPDTKTRTEPEQDRSARIRTPRSKRKQSTQTRESAQLEHTRTRALTRKQDKRGVSELCHKTTNKLDRSDRTLTVRVNSVLSSSIVTNTGAPQGSTISPVLFTLYTNECRGSSSDVLHIKYADDTAIVGLITDDEVDYRRGVDEFVDWCQSSFLQLNIRKTKEIIFDKKRHTPTNSCQW